MSKPVVTSDHRVVFWGLLILVLVFGVLGFWMATAPLKSAAVASGKITVESNKKVVQHLEGGVVEQIRIQDGDEVRAGDILLLIKDAKLQAELEIVEREYLEAKVLESRLKAERDSIEKLVFPEEIVRIRPTIAELVEGQERVFVLRQKLRRNEKEIMRQRILQLQEQIRGVNSIIQSRQKHYASINEEMNEWQRLYKKQLTDKVRLRDLKRESIQIDGEIAAQNADISKLKVQITETKAQIVLQERAFIEEVLSQLQQTQLKLSDLQARTKALKEQRERTKIKSPVDGTVVGLEVHTVGGVIASGSPILSIVPKNSPLIIEANLQTIDIDKVHVGLVADVRFSAFKQQMVHVVEGEVTHVSADSFVDEQSGQSFYKIRVIVSDQGRVQLKSNGFFLVPGMPVEVMVKTGERTVLSYLVNPFLNMLSKAFKED